MKYKSSSLCNHKTTSVQSCWFSTNLNFGGLAEELCLFGDSAFLKAKCKLEVQQTFPCIAQILRSSKKKKKKMCLRSISTCEGVGMFMKDSCKERLFLDIYSCATLQC